MHRTLVIGSVVLALTLVFPAIQLNPAWSQVQQNIVVEKLEGKYKVRGHNPDGSAYSGSLRIKVVDGVANFTWNVAGDTFRGQGSLVGNVLVVNWGNAAPVLYTIDLDGNLAGTWDGGNASERATRQ